MRLDLSKERAEAMTAGRLRALLTDVADDMPIFTIADNEYVRHAEVDVAYDDLPAFVLS
jgi:hypothetical protein